MKFNSGGKQGELVGVVMVSGGKRGELVGVVMVSGGKRGEVYRRGDG